MAKSAIAWMILSLLVMTIGNRQSRLFAQESQGFSSNTPYISPSDLSETDRKKIIKVANSQEMDNNAPAIKEMASGQSKTSGAAQGQELPVAPLSDSETTVTSVSELEKQKVGGRVAQNEPQTGVPDNGGKTSGNFFFVKYLGSFLVVIGLIIMLAWFYYRLSPARHLTAGSIQILTRTPVNSRQSICLVKIGSRLLVVGLSAGHMTTLDTIEEPDEVARILGGIEKSMPHSISNMHAFKGLFKREAGEYDTETSTETIVDFDDTAKPHWQDARDELAGLFNKVKGLARIRSKS